MQRRIRRRSIETRRGLVGRKVRNGLPVQGFCRHEEFICAVVAAGTSRAGP